MNELFLKNRVLIKNIDTKVKKKISKNYIHQLKKIKLEINNPNETLNVLSKNYTFNFSLKDLKRFKKFKNIALIGMGGSILGAEAIYSFFKKKINKKIFFFDDLDENKIINFKKKEKISKTLFIIISKSGNTTETLFNTFSLNIIKHNAKNIIIITEKKNNLLFNISKKFNLFFIEHKSKIGGRYSVLSEVGIVPAYLMGINVLKLRSKIHSFLGGSERMFLKESSIYLSFILNTKKYKNIIFLNYAPELEKFLSWCQQLIAESLGKNSKGFLPVISNVPKDHHSLLQLYLDGPNDKLFYIFSIDFKSKLKINLGKALYKKNFLNKKTLSLVKNAQKNSLIKCLQKKEIPFREFKLKKINEEVLGKMFSYFILETILIGKLSKINPFNQPAVEQVKIYTKEFLK